MKKPFLLIIYTLFILLLVGCQDRDSTNPDPTNLEEDQFAKELKDKPLTFLVLGIDSRGEEQSRADSILVVHYIAEDRTLKIVSLMRDSYVKIPNYKHDFGKINEAYYEGGEKLLQETIKNNFGIEIDHTVTIDFKGFVNVVDTLVPEGITVTVNQTMIDDMNLQMAPGENTLNGEELLKYARFRHDQQSDFGRVGRQQEILLKVMNTMNEKINSLIGVTKVPLLVDEAIKNIDTDLTVTQILTLSSTMFLQPIEQIDTMRIPVNKGFVNKTYDHSGAVLELNFLKNKEAMQKFFSEPTPVND